MFKLLTVLLIAVALTHQAQFEDPKVEKSAKDIVEKAFHELERVIKKAANEGAHALDKALNQVQATAARVEKEAKTEVDTLMGPWAKKITDLVAKAKAEARYFAECEHYVSDFAAIPSRFIRDEESCVKTQIVNAERTYKDAVNQVKKLEDDFLHVGSEIHHCKGNVFKKAKCYLKLAKKIAEDIVKAPHKIAEDVAKEAKLVTDFVPRVEACATNQLKRAGEEASADIAGFSACSGI